MQTKAPYQLAIIIGIALLTSNCAYFDRIRQDVNYLQIKKSISKSRLEEIKKFTGRAPLSEAYEFSFIDVHNKSFSLLFTVHENSFSECTLKYRKANDIRRDADRIDKNMGILTALNQNLPRPGEISWKTIDQFPSEEARDGYQIMLEYIRYKIRDS